MFIWKINLINNYAETILVLPYKLWKGGNVIAWMKIFDCCVLSDGKLHWSFTLCVLKVIAASLSLIFTFNLRCSSTFKQNLSENIDFISRIVKAVYRRKWKEELLIQSFQGESSILRTSYVVFLPQRRNQETSTEQLVWTKISLVTPLFDTLSSIDSHNYWFSPSRKNWKDWLEC